MLGPDTAESRDRFRSGSTVIAPPGSTVIIIPPSGPRHFHGPVRRHDRGIFRDRRQMAPFEAHGWTTPGFSSGFTTPGFSSRGTLNNRFLGDLHRRR
jgi:hypothetical protein